MADIGEQLRKAREEKGLSLEDIEKITKIQYRYLKDLENDEFDKLPGDFYARAFIKQYAQVVGLNGNELLNSLHSDVPEAKPEKYVENSIDNKSEEVRRTTNNKKGLWRAYLPKAATIIGIFLVIFVIYLVYSHFFAANPNQQNADQTNNITVSSSSESSSKTSKKTTRTTKTTSSKIKIESLGNNQYRVRDWNKAKNRDLKLSTGADAAYVQVAVDGKVIWQGTLDKNTSHDVKLSKTVKNVSVQFGNTKSTKLSLDGKNIKAQNENSLNSPMTIRFIFDSTSSTQSSNTGQSTYTSRGNSAQSTSGTSSTTTTQSQRSSQRIQSNGTQNTTNSQNQQSQNRQSTQSVQQSTPTTSNNSGQGQTGQSTTGGQNR